MEEKIYESPAYRRSRTAYRWECTFEYFVTLLVTDAFLATLLKAIGLSDAQVGIVSSLVSFAFLFQLLAIFVVQRVKNVKLFAMLWHAFSNLCFMSLYLLPFLPVALPYKKVLTFGAVLLAYLGNYLVTTMIFKWANSHVDPHKRARYSAGKEMLSLLTGMVVTLLIGYGMDYFTGKGWQDGGFIFAACAIFIFAACDFICLLLIKAPDKVEGARPATAPFREVLKNTLGNRRFLYVVLLTVIFDMSRYSILGFVGTYRISELAFSVGAVQIINLVGNACRFFASKPFGRFSDRFSYVKGVSLGMLLAAIGYALLVFTTPQTRYLVIVSCIFTHVSAAGTNQNLMNITYSYVDSRYFVQATAIKNSVGGICGFLSALLSARLLSYVQNGGNRLFGIQVYGQQVLALIATVGLLLAVLFIHLTLGKQKTMLQ